MLFLNFLRDEIRTGLEKTDSVYRVKHARWIAGQQAADGGFRNRRGNTELYYTTFGLRSLSALNGLTPDIAGNASRYLLSIRQNTQHSFGDAVSAASWWDALALCEEVLGPCFSDNEREQTSDHTIQLLGKLHRDDGGWAKTSMEGNASLYHTFLALCAYQRMNRPLPEVSRIEKFLSSMAHMDGGFLENRYSKKPGTNGTAAGIALSLMLQTQTLLGRMALGAGLQQKLQPWIAKHLTTYGAKSPVYQALLQPWIAKHFTTHVAFIRRMHCREEGGFMATPSAPVADLLSTYTALFTLKNLGQTDVQIHVRALQYARSLEDSEGGYVGFLLETMPDCEYTFYGLGVESIST